MTECKGRHPKDRFLEDRLARYDRWRREGKISTSSRVVPIRESLSARQWVLQTEQAIEILRQAEAFALSRIEGLGYERVAELLGCSQQTARVHLHRALKRLARELGDYLRKDDR